MFEILTMRIGIPGARYQRFVGTVRRVNWVRGDIVVENFGVWKILGCGRFWGVKDLEMMGEGGSWAGRSGYI